MKCHCVDTTCLTVTEAVSVVEKYECILGSQNGTVRALESMPTNKTSEDLVEVVKRLEDKVDRLEKKYENKNRMRNDKNNHTCFGCNSPNHLWRNCPKNARINHNANNFSSRNGSRNPPMTKHIKMLLVICKIHLLSFQAIRETRKSWL